MPKNQQSDFFITLRHDMKLVEERIANQAIKIQALARKANDELQIRHHLQRQRNPS